MSDYTNAHGFHEARLDCAHVALWYVHVKSQDPFTSHVGTKGPQDLGPVSGVRE